MLITPEMMMCFDAAAQYHQVNPIILRSIAQVESNFNPKEMGSGLAIKHLSEEMGSGLAIMHLSTFLHIKLLHDKTFKI